MLKALIDGDILRYRCGFAAEETQYQVLTFDAEDQLIDSSPVFKYKSEAVEALRHGHFDWQPLRPEGGRGEITRLVNPEPVENCLHSVKLQIQQILNDLNTKEYDVYLTAHEPTFRDRIATLRKYKGNRADAPRPYHYDAITDYLVGTWGATTVTGIEADDQLGIASMESLDSTAIATLDKDLDMIPGWHYNFVKREKYYVTESQARYAFYYQLLVGDATDNIVGCPGCGPAGATKLLLTLPDDDKIYYQTCLEEYKRAEYDKDSKRKYQLPEGVTAEEALLENARLLWIWRKPNDEWTPPC